MTNYQETTHQLELCHLSKIGNAVRPVRITDISTAQPPVFVGPVFDTARPIGRYLVPLFAPDAGVLSFITLDGGRVSAALEDREGRTTLRFRKCPDVDAVYRTLMELGQPVLHLNTAPKDMGAALVRGRCRICDCTMERACPSGCWWADDTESLCLQHGS